jgi:transposase
MESTGEYWKPVYNILEEQFELLVVNAHHVKHVPGRKTDVNDAQWLSTLMQQGLLSKSFLPPQGQRELREMTRARAGMVRERTNLVNRLHKTLESANIKLASVATDLQGVSARAMLKALIEGHTDARSMADLACGRMRSKRTELEAALTGRVKPHHRFILAQLLSQIDALDASIADFTQEIGRMCAPFESAIAHLDTIPGIGRVAAEALVSEMGADMSPFPTQRHISAWAGVAPGNHQSAGKTLSRRTRQGNPNLKRVLIEAAQAAVHVKDTYLSAQYHRLAGRRGKKRAIVAVAHSILVISYHLITRDEDYKELGGNYFDTRQPAKTAQNLVSRLVQLGYEVELNPRVQVAAA